MNTDTRIRILAEKIAQDLFDGNHHEATRLVMEYANGPKLNGPGLCLQAVVDRIAEALSRTENK